MKPCEWMIFYSEVKGRVGCLPVGSTTAPFLGETTVVLTSIFGTEEDAIEECKRQERQKVFNPDGIRKYEWKALA